MMRQDPKVHPLKIVCIKKIWMI